MKSQESDNDIVRATVRERYGRIAASDGSCGCNPTCCNASPSETETNRDMTSKLSQALGYSSEELSATPIGANLALGCGNPQAIAALKPGERVLDLGSGAGIDVFLAARAVGPTGHVIGVDMTPEMISKARSHPSKSEVPNTEFRLGEIENLPVADESIDVILSNCVINLSSDKPRVFQEAYRVLRSGGRLAISDIVALGVIPDSMRRDWALYTGCVAGAASMDELRKLVADAGFTGIEIVPISESREIIGGWFPGSNIENFVASATIEAVKPNLIDEPIS